MIRSTIFLLATSVALALAAQSIHAQPTGGEVVVTAPWGGANLAQHKHETVKYADLDIQSPDGAKAMVRRLKKAAGRVCMPMPKKDLADKSNHSSCVQGAMSGAVAALNSPAVQQAYDASK